MDNVYKISETTGSNKRILVHEIITLYRSNSRHVQEILQTFLFISTGGVAAILS